MRTQASKNLHIENNTLNYEKYQNFDAYAFESYLALHFAFMLPGLRSSCLHVFVQELNRLCKLRVAVK